MKRQLLTKEQVNNNLAEIFPDKNWQCFYAQDGCYVIESPGKGRIMIDEFKKVFVQGPDKNNAFKYAQFCNDHGVVHVVKRAVCGEFIPFVWQWKTAEAELKQQHDQLLKCVGYGKPEKKETEVTTIQRLAGTDYANYYKLIKQVTVIRAYIRTKPAVDGELKQLRVIHSTGSFSFLIRNITGNQVHDQLIRELFFELLNIPMVTKLAA